MAQELIDKIRAAAQAKGIDPEVALRIARAESGLKVNATPGTSSAGGLFQVVDKTWKEFGGAPGKKFDPDENIRVGTDIIAKNAQTLKAFLQRDPRPAEVYAAHYFGPSGAKTFLSAEPGTPMESLFSKEVIKANPNLKGKTSDQVMASLEKKMGGKPAAAAATATAAPAAPQEAQTPAERIMEPALQSGMTAQAPAPAPDKLAALGPSYQAALALSFLADTDEKEDRDIDREPSVAEKWLAESATRPAALGEFADLKIKSPFAEPQPQMLADGGEVTDEPAPDVGKPTVQEEYLAKTMFPELPVAEAVYLLRGGGRQSTPQGEMLSGNMGVRVPLGKDAEAMFMLAGSRPERNQSSSKAMLAMLNQRLGEGNVGATLVRPMDAPGGVYAGNMSASYPLGEGRISGNVNAMRTPDGRTMMTDYGVGYGGRVGPGDLTVGISRRANNGPYSGRVEYRLPIGRADGGEVAEPGLLSVPTYSRTVSYEMYPGQEGQFDQRDAARHMLAAGTLSRKYGPKAAEILGQLHEIGTSPLKFLGSKLGISEMPIDYEQDLHNNRIGIELGKRSKSQKDLEDLVQQMAEQARGERTEGKAWKGKPVRRADGSPEEGERLTPQQIERIAAQEAAEREIASKPAFLTPKSGKGRQISTKTGELEAAALQGVTEAPYLLAGAPVDLATMAMRPFGYNVEKPMFGSEDLKQRALDAGIRQKPPEGKAARALYELTQAGASAVNPAAPVRGAVAAAEKTGEAAKMLARDFGEYNRQLSVPGASYAVKPKGGPFAVEGQTYGSPADFSKPVNSVDNFINTYLADTRDHTLNEWFRNKVGAYVKRDLGTEGDQFVRAADEGRKLHFVQKPITEGYTGPHMPSDIRNLRRTEGFPEEGFAKTPYGQKVEMITDRAVDPIALEDMFPSNVPPSMLQFTKSDPTMRVYALAPTQFDELRLSELRDKMLKMRQMSPEFSKYGQPAVKVPEQYQLSDKTLQGLTPAQASERVVQFDAWKQEAQQKMASRAAFADPAISRTPASGGHVWVNPPDLERNPTLRELVQDIGCDGGWCTKGENYALNYGSGENRLTVLMDNKARPRAQMTINSKEYGPDDFIESLADDEVAAFRAKYPDIAAYHTDKIAGTPEFQEWQAINPGSISITEIKGVNNQADLKDAPYLKQIQQRVKDLDSANMLTSVDNLDGIRMVDLDEYLPALSMLSKSSFGRPLSIEQESQLSAFMKNLNNGSRYVDKNEGKNIFNEADRMLRPSFHPPQQRAFGGMIERP